MVNVEKKKLIWDSIDDEDKDSTGENKLHIKGIHEEVNKHVEKNRKDKEEVKIKKNVNY